MQALVLEDFGRMVVVDRDHRDPRPGEVAVAVAAVGICGSDIHGFTGENGRRRPGQLMGHEAAGRVHALGDGVTGLEPGDAVTFNPVIGCGRCTACASGHRQQCPDRQVIGVDPEIPAAFAERIVVPATNVVPLGADFPVELGALVEPLAVAVHAVGRAAIRPGDVTLVLGGGPIGQSAVLALARAGATTVLVSEPDPARRRLCADLGAHAIDPGSGSIRDQVLHAAGRPADVALDAVGISASLADAFAATRDGATVVLVGMGTPRLDLSAFDVSVAERSIIGSFCYSDADFTDTAAWARSHADDLRRLVSQEVPLRSAPATFEMLAHRPSVAGKVLVRFDTDD